MSNFWKYFLFLLWMSYLLICGVLLFSRGFLLRRHVQTERSFCSSNLYCDSQLDQNSSSFQDQKLNDNFKSCHVNSDSLHHPDSKKDGCPLARAKVMLIVIDALKYDFLLYDEKLRREEWKPYQNRMPVIHELLKYKPENSRLYKFIADPPTTTMQRLSALTTGSLPTFVDIGSNFASAEIKEDNIIDQLVSKGEKAIFMGDDTWTGLYPGRFERQYPFESFNVWDLDTCDTGVKKDLIPEMKKKDWRLLIGHFLGVDHCGHRYGPYHEEMSRKLQEMNDVIREIVNSLEDDTMLIVLGDHGMTDSGDHGGGSEEEVTAGLFVYSKTELLNKQWSPKGDIVCQVDLVPTLSTILGIPIPFSNIGSVIIDILPKVSTSPEDDSSNWQFALQSVWDNAKQAMTYIEKYAQRNEDFKREQVSSLQEEFQSISNKIGNINTEDEFIKLELEVQQFMTSLRNMCESVWVQFDPFSITWGLVFTFVVLIIMFLVIEALPGERLTFAASEIYLTLAYIGMAGVIVVCYLLHRFQIVETFEHGYFVFTFGVSFLFLAAMCTENSEAIFNKWRAVAKYKTWVDIFSRIICLLSLWSVSSNSFVVSESSVLSFFLLSLIATLVYCYQLPWEEVMTGSGKNIKNDKSSISWLRSQIHPYRLRVIIVALVLCGFVRVSHSFWICREEQAWCMASGTEKPLEASQRSSLSTDPHCFAMLVCISLWVTVTRMWLSSCGNLTGYAPTVLLARYVPTVVAVCSGGFWVLQALPGETKRKLFKSWQLQLLPWTVYALSSLTIVSLILRPLCIFVVRNRKESFSVELHRNPIPQLYNQIKSMISGNKHSSEQNGLASSNAQQPVVYGLATAYSASFTVMGVLLVLIISLLLGSRLAPAAVFMACASTILLLLITMIRFENALVSIQLLTVSWPAVLCWSLFAQYFFYGTGHQATFPSIQWNAAMIGTGGTVKGSTFFPALLVVMNTFASHIYQALMLPLLMIAPMTVHVMIPRWASTPVDHQDLSKGELMMFQREDFMYRSLTTLAARYIFLQGIRSMACMVSATIHARHLMVWKIFAPKFIFEALSLFVTLPCVLLAYLFMGRISNCVQKLLDSLDASRNEPRLQQRSR